MVYADLFFQTKTALQRSIQEEEDQRKLLEEGLQLQIADMMDAIKAPSQAPSTAFSTPLLRPG
jgi:hypothetical protein